MVIKEQYNKNLKRIHNAIDYLDNKNIDYSERIKHEEAFKQLLHNQNILIQKLGLRSGDKEILNGFQDIK